MSNPIGCVDLLGYFVCWGCRPSSDGVDHEVTEGRHICVMCDQLVGAEGRYRLFWVPQDKQSGATMIPYMEGFKQ